MAFHKTIMNMNKLSAYVFILGLLNTQAHGSTVCPNASPRDKSTKVVNLIREMPPIRDQDGIGWCYSFTSADLLTHYLYKTKGKNLQNNGVLNANFGSKEYSVSAMGIASKYNQSVPNKAAYTKSLSSQSSADLAKNKKKVVAEGGTLTTSLDIVKTKGFCFEKDISSSDFSYVSDKRCLVQGKCKISEVLNIIYDSKDKLGCNDISPIKKVFPSLKLTDIYNILLKSSKQEALFNLSNAVCNKKFKSSLPSGQPQYQSKTITLGQSPNELLKFLESHLDRGIPVGIQYYADFLIGKPGSTYGHASSIIGKAFNPQTCEVEYILRNSWGQGCGYYIKNNPGYEKCMKGIKSEKNAKKYNLLSLACKNSNKPTPRNPKVRCESPGHVYVSKSELAKQILNVTAIQEDK